MILAVLPIIAACFAIPQFVPQILKLRMTDDTAGVSWSWAMLTSVNNVAWLAYFLLSRYWIALVPSVSATVLAAVLATMITLRHGLKPRPAAMVGVWAVMVAGSGILAGRTGLGAALTVAFALQVSPSIWTAYRAASPTGVAAGTWLLILGELSCWTVYGLHESDPRLIALGFTGVTASLLMLGRLAALPDALGAIRDGRASGPRPPSATITTP
jgi:hypothetical protein